MNEEQRNVLKHAADLHLLCAETMDRKAKNGPEKYRGYFRESADESRQLARQLMEGVQ